MKTNYWKCPNRKFLSLTSPKRDENDKIKNMQFNIKFIFGCVKNPAPEGKINLCRLKVCLLEPTGICPII